ncbi:hypothetical protein ACJMK2_023069 [Sinanodonta woodiana]|uniref:Zinc finger PHD-type domain-containing protein n=1 Tax=Sinanodonta woodiana TaxID=1069815 RepID=A0ABD3T312_SINWO
MSQEVWTLDPISCILYGDALSCERENDVHNARINGKSKNRYRHHNVNSKTSSCFNYATDLLCFATEAYVIASSRSMMDKDNIPKDIEKLWCYFQSIAKKVVALEFHPPELQDCNADSSYCGLCQLEWFHLTCLGLSDNDVPVGEWFCSGQCEVMSTKSTNDYKSNQDHIFEYSKALLWRGLGEMAPHDAISEGDRDRIINHWRQKV